MVLDLLAEVLDMLSHGKEKLVIPVLRDHAGVFCILSDHATVAAVLHQSESNRASGR